MTDDYTLDMTIRPDSEFLGTDQLSDDELTALALAADPAAPIGDDALPLNVHLGLFAGALPQWYMPAAVARSGQRWRTPVVMGVVAAFLLIEALGLCNTYGTLGL
ncbi:MAG TPA: hypothetical protein VHV57_12095 [Acidimicrobiales bacterium]|jgi:hypothetical protein|nr:hypothetical protein [Acidimicrobiales bacterium]